MPLIPPRKEGRIGKATGATNGALETEEHDHIPAAHAASHCTVRLQALSRLWSRRGSGITIVLFARDCVHRDGAKVQRSETRASLRLGHVVAPRPSGKISGRGLAVPHPPCWNHIQRHKTCTPHRCTRRSPVLTSQNEMAERCVLL